MKRLFVFLLVLFISVPAFSESPAILEGPDGFYLQKTNGQWRLYDSNDTLLLDYFWEDAELYEYRDDWGTEHPMPFYGFQENGLALVRFGIGEDSVFGAIDRDGEFVIPPLYTNIGIFEHDCFKVRIGDKVGLVHKSGAVALPTEYDKIELYGNPACTATVGERSFDFALHGAQAVPFTVNAGSIDMEAYLPHTGSQTPALDETASLRLTDNLPRLDGATALLPLYCGVAQAVYPDDVRFERTEEVADPVVAFTNTPGSYYRLIHGQCDLIFVAQPSDQQLADAAEAGVEFELTPIATEAFVFFVNGGNPLEGLTVDQIRSIYSGRITQWDELGVPGIGTITAYQRPKNSGSQTALENLMGDVPLMDPPSESDGFTMDDIVNVIEYRNTPDALGYSFRFYLTTMMDSDVNLLAVDGVTPTEENIANGTYPIIAQIYAVSRKGEENPNVRALLNWLASDQGKELIRRSGYVPLP